jgi:hypothetical protein
MRNARANAFDCAQTAVTSMADDDLEYYPLPEGYGAEPTARIRVGPQALGEIASTDYQPDAFDLAAGRVQRRYAAPQRAVLPAGPNDVMDTLRSLPRGVMGGLADTAAVGGQAAAIEMGDDRPQPTGEEGLNLLEQNVTGALPQPVTEGGRVGASIGHVAGNPANWVAPGLLRTLGYNVASGITSELGRKLYEGTPNERVAQVLGGFGPGVAERASALYKFLPQGSAGAIGGKLVQPTFGQRIISSTSPFELARPQPEMFHRISDRKLTRPLEDIPFETTGAMPAQPPPVTPTDMAGKFIMPVVGDRTAAGPMLHSVDNIPLTIPLELRGGHGYMRNYQGWANDAAQANEITSRAARYAKKYGTDVIGAYTAMSPRSGDFSHQTWETLGRMLPNAPMTRAGRQELNEQLRGMAGLAQAPSVGSTKLAPWLYSQPNAARQEFIRAVDQSRIPGTPDVTAVRTAITDPALLNAPANSSGLSMTRLTGGATSKGTHPDFPQHIPGEGSLSFGQQLPREVMYQDMVQAFHNAGKPPPDWARTMYMTPSYVDRGQLATPQWVESTSKYLEDVPKLGQQEAFNRFLKNRFKWGAVGVPAAGAVMGGLAQQDSYQ